MSRAIGAALAGVDGVAVEVEVCIRSTLPRVDVVGLPEAAVRESTARVRSAIQAAGHRFPNERVTVNLAPAELRKSGSALDLPIAVAILAASAALPADELERLGFVGELALDGRLRPVRGALALALAAYEAGGRRVIVPEANAVEAALAPGVEVLGAPDLPAVIRHLQTGQGLRRTPTPELRGVDPGLPDLRDVRGQERAKRSLVIAAAGGHALLLRGPPGSGKTMLARRLPGLLPPLDFDEVVEVTRIHGAAGRLGDRDGVVRERPFRAPHHSASVAGLLGGGSPPRPGEVSLAHRGVLFLDELPEFERRALEGLRQVLEERRVVIARARTTCIFPADWLFVCAGNPCPCGWLGSDVRECRCDDGAVARYTARISGPLLDRIDLHVNVPALRWRDLEQVPSGPSSADIRTRVLAARQVQANRLAGLTASRFRAGRRPGRRSTAKDRRPPAVSARPSPAPGVRLSGSAPPTLRTNAEIPDPALDALADATPDARALLGRAVDRLGLSARSARRLLRVARTIADLEGRERVGPSTMAEALGFRD